MGHDLQLTQNDQSNGLGNGVTDGTRLYPFTIFCLEDEVDVTKRKRRRRRKKATHDLNLVSNATAFRQSRVFPLSVTTEFTVCQFTSAQLLNAPSTGNQVIELKVGQELGISDCVQNDWPVYYRVIPTPTDMVAVANHVRQNMKFKNNNGWGNFNELITGLSLFIESRR